MIQMVAAERMMADKCAICGVFAAMGRTISGKRHFYDSRAAKN
jgi:ribosomal protein L28